MNSKISSDKRLVRHEEADQEETRTEVKETNFQDLPPYQSPKKAQLISVSDIQDDYQSHSDISFSLYHEDEAASQRSENPALSIFESTTDEEQSFHSVPESQPDEFGHRSQDPITREEAREWVTDFYSKYSPDNLGRVEEVLDTYSSDYQALFDGLKAKYCDSGQRTPDSRKTQPSISEEEARKWVTDFYHQYCPQNVYKVENLLKTYSADYQALFDAVTAKYCSAEQTQDLAQTQSIGDENAEGLQLSEEEGRTSANKSLIQHSQLRLNFDGSDRHGTHPDHFSQDSKVSDEFAERGPMSRKTISNARQEEDWQDQPSSTREQLLGNTTPAKKNIDMEEDSESATNPLIEHSQTGLHPTSTHQSETNSCYLPESCTDSQDSRLDPSGALALVQTKEQNEQEDFPSMIEKSLDDEIPTSKDIFGEEDSGSASNPLVLSQISLCANNTCEPETTRRHLPEFDTASDQLLEDGRVPRYLLATKQVVTGEESNSSIDLSTPQLCIRKSAFGNDKRSKRPSQKNQGLPLPVFEWCGPQNFNGWYSFKEPNSRSLQLTSNFTVSAWVYPTSKTTNWTRVIGKGFASQNYAICIKCLNGMCFVRGLCDTTSGIYQTDDSDSIPIKNWIHLTLTHVKDVALTLYIDGKIAAFKPIRGRPLIGNDNLSIGMVGPRWTAGKVGFVGKIQQVRIYRTAFSEDAIRSREGLSFPVFQREGPDTFDSFGCVQIPSSNSLQLNDDFTVSVWVCPKLKYRASSSRIIGKGNRDRQNYAISITTSGAVFGHCDTSCGPCSTKPSDEIPMQKWSNLLLTHKKNTALSLYVDGQQATSTPVKGNPIIDASCLTIGKADWDDNPGFDGEVGLVQIYKRVFTSDEMQKLGSTLPLSLSKEKKKTAAIFFSALLCQVDFILDILVVFVLNHEKDSWGAYYVSLAIVYSSFFSSLAGGTFGLSHGKLWGVLLGFLGLVHVAPPILSFKRTDPRGSGRAEAVLFKRFHLYLEATSQSLLQMHLVFVRVHQKIDPPILLLVSVVSSIFCMAYGISENWMVLFSERDLVNKPLDYWAIAFFLQCISGALAKVLSIALLTSAVPNLAFPLLLPTLLMRTATCWCYVKMKPVVLGIMTATSNDSKEKGLQKRLRHKILKWAIKFAVCFLHACYHLFFDFDGVRSHMHLALACLIQLFEMTVCVGISHMQSGFGGPEDFTSVIVLLILIAFLIEKLILLLFVMSYKSKSDHRHQGLQGVWKKAQNFERLLLDLDDELKAIAAWLSKCRHRKAARA